MKKTISRKFAVAALSGLMAAGTLTACDGVGGGSYKNNMMKDAHGCKGTSGCDHKEKSGCNANGCNHNKEKSSCNANGCNH